MGFFDFLKPKTPKVKPGDIMKTTDGFLVNNVRNKKTRHVVIYDKRADGAVAISKIYSKEDKNLNNAIPNLELNPKNHKSLTKTSIVGKRVIFGIKNGNTYKPIHTRQLTKTNDRLTTSERIKFKNGAGGSSNKNKTTLKNTTSKWKNNFK